jgi:hypothetical protein
METLKIYLFVNVENLGTWGSCVRLFIYLFIFIIRYLIGLNESLINYLPMLSSSFNVYHDSFKLLNKVETLLLITNNCGEERKLFRFFFNEIFLWTIL